MNSQNKKLQKRKQQWIIFGLLALMFGALRFVMADCGGGMIDGCASVSVGNATWTWTDEGCTGRKYSCAPTSNPVMVGKCSSAGGSAEARALGSWSCSSSSIIPGSFTVEVGETGCKYKTWTSGCGAWGFRVWCPKKHGHVTLKAQVDGTCVYCDYSNTTQCEEACTASGGGHWEVIGTIDVKLTPEEEQDDTPCPDDDGNGGSGSGGCTSGCSGNQPSAGAGSVNNDSVNFRLYLGRSTPKDDAGYIQLYSPVASTSLQQPGALTVPFTKSSPGVQVLNDTGGAVKQVVAPQILVNVNTISTYEYHLECYYIGDVTLGGDGYYHSTGPSPFATWIVKNPDAASAYNRLWLTEQRGSAQRTFQYTYTASSSRWDLLQPDGQTTLSTWFVADGTDSTITNYFRQVTSNSQLLSKVQRTYKFVSALNDKELTQKIEGDGTTTRTTTYSYYSSDPSNGGNANQLQRVDYTDGSFDYYKYDSSSRKITMYSTFENNAAPPNTREPIPTTDLCKVTQYAYTLTYDPGQSDDDGVADDGSDNPWTIRRTIVQVPVSGTLHEISRKYCHVYSGDTWEIQECPTPGALWGASDNLRTITVVNSDNKPTVLCHSDGTATLYSYSSDYSTTIVQTGEPDSFDSPGSIVNGTQTTAVLDSLGIIQSRTTVALQPSLSPVTLASETYNYTDGSGHNLDPLERSCNVTDLAGRVTQYRYSSCCGLDYVVDSDGVTTTYIYEDNSKRLLGSSKVVAINGSSQSIITTTNQLDGIGQVLASMRVGTDGSVVTLSKSQYDLLGRVMRETNALTGVTTHTNFYDSTSGFTITTNTYPDLGTRIEMYARDGQLVKTLGTAASLVRYVNDVEADSSLYRVCRQEIKLNADGSDSSEWTKTFSDGAGQIYKTLYAPRSGVDANPPAQLSFYNQYGKVWKQSDPDGVTTLFTYDGRGQTEYTALALTSATKNTADYATLVSQLGDGTIQGRADRIAQVERSVVAAAGSMPNLTQVNTYQFVDGQTSGSLVSSVQRSVDGLNSWSVVYRDASTPILTSATTVPGTSRTETTIAADGTQTINQYQYGRLVSSTRSSSSLGTLSSTTCGYDAQGRQATITDARNGMTYSTFNSADQVVSTTTPSPGLGQSPQTTTTTYDASLRAVQITQPDGTIVTNKYDVTGLLTNTCGSRTYPVAYTYDSQGRMKTMTTWTNYSTKTGAATTTWNYNAYRDWLDNKRYADSTGPDYTYTPGGRLKTRAWARTGTGGNRITTTYSYGFDNGHFHGDLEGIAYSNDPQSTPGVAYTYNRMGRQSTVTRNSITTTVTYNLAGQIQVEANSGGILDALSVTNGYDQFMRRTNVVVLSGSTAVCKSTNSFDAASRLATVGDGLGQTATYSYVANSPAVGQITFKQSGTTRMTTTKNYDYVNRLVSVQNSAAPSFVYDYDAADQRIRRTDADGAYWRYGYDSLGQVTSAVRYWSDQTPVAGQQFGYAFDHIGNRTSAKFGGDQNGANLRSGTYTANNLNQYTSRQVPGYVEVTGLELATNSVTVNGSAAYRKGEYFQKEISVSNGSVPVWQSITVSAPNETTVSGNAFLAKTPESFSYDSDGNLLSDGRRNYTWDAENRLIAMAANTAVGPQNSLKFEYDAKGRRIRKQVWSGTTWSGSPTNDVEFVYDGWNLQTEVNTSHAAVRSYVWGLDLSRSLQGAGGVGGLLQATYYGSPNTTCFAGFDGNGNVATLVNAADGTTLASYEYGPFGEVIRATGTMANANPLRFSSKYQDNESDLLYYGYRYYNASTGRWLARDPAEEGMGGPNLYGFVANDPLVHADRLGRDFRWVTPKYNPNGTPRQGPDGGWQTGGTSWLKFDPKVEIWRRPNEPCCIGLRFSGNYAQVYSWWSDTASMAHEITHIQAHFYPGYLGYKGESETYFSPCKTSAQAHCLKAAIEVPLAQAWLAWVKAVGLAWDCQQYGHSACQEAEDAQRTYERLNRAAHEKLAKCLTLD